MGSPINYDPNTPSPQLPFADWQIQFIQNFTQLYNAFSQNHVALDDPTSANRGNHTYIQMPEQSFDPQTGSQEFSIYTKNVETQTDQVFFTYSGNSPVIQFTNYQIYNILPTSTQTTNFTFLPGGIIIYFGYVTFTSVPGGNILVLNPTISKNIIATNLCLKGTIPNYTPGIIPEVKFSETPGVGLVVPGIIKEMYILPSTQQTYPASAFYIVVANT